MFLQDTSFDHVLNHIEKQLDALMLIEDITKLKNEISRLAFAIHFAQHITEDIIGGIPVSEGE